MVASICEKTKTIEQKNRENERLLLNILPEAIALRLKSGETTIADSFAEATVLFADVVSFTTLCSRTTPQQLVNMLNDLFSRFDEGATRAGVEKIKTIGDAYMAVAGLPTPHPDHARRIDNLGLDMLQQVREFRREHQVDLSIRIGINTGPVVAGIIGSTKFIYDLWGDTVNIASRMESQGIADTIQVTRAVVERLGNEFAFHERGGIELKGRGTVETWLLSLQETVAQQS
jgi:class 3 adenylate cyclase